MTRQLLVAVAAAVAVSACGGGADRNQTDSGKAGKLRDFLLWAIHDGQKTAATLDYAPLPPNIVKMLDTRLRGLVAAR